MYFFRSSHRKNPLTPSKLPPSPSIAKRRSSSLRRRPRHVHPDPAAARALQLRQLRAIVRLAPRLDRILLDRLGHVRHDQIHIQLDDVPEAVAYGAGPKRVVEREEPRLRHLVLQAARPALETLAEAVHHGLRIQRNRERGAAALGVGRFDRVSQARPEVAIDLEPVDDHLQHRPIAERSGVRFFQHHGLAVDVEPAESLAAQDPQRLGDRVAQPWKGRLRWCRDLRITIALRHRLVIVRSFDGKRHRRSWNDRHIEADQQPGSGRQLAERPGHDLRRLADDFLAARAADRPADPRVQQPQIVVNLGCRPDRGPGVADTVLLADRDRRRDALDGIDVRLLHPLEELTRVGGQRFHVASLAFRVNSVERQGRLAGAAHARHDDE